MIRQFLQQFIAVSKPRRDRLDVMEANAAGWVRFHRETIGGLAVLLLPVVAGVWLGLWWTQDLREQTAALREKIARDKELRGVRGAIEPTPRPVKAAAKPAPMSPEDRQAWADLLSRNNNPPVWLSGTSAEQNSLLLPVGVIGGYGYGFRRVGIGRGSIAARRAAVARRVGRSR